MFIGYCILLLVSTSQSLDRWYSVQAFFVVLAALGPVINLGNVAQATEFYPLMAEFVILIWKQSGRNA